MTNSHSAVIDAVIDLAQDALTDASYPLVIVRGPASTGTCVAAEPSYGAAQDRFLDKNAVFIATLVFNSKNADMQAALNALEQILLSLTRRTAYPHAEAWQIANVSTNALPMLIGREEDNTWLYAASVNVNYYVRGD